MPLKAFGGGFAADAGGVGECGKEDSGDGGRGRLRLSPGASLRTRP